MVIIQLNIDVINFAVSSCYVVQNTANHNYNQAGAEAKLQIVVAKQSLYNVPGHYMRPIHHCNAVHYLLLA